MVDAVIRKVKLPGKGIVNIKVPSDWSPDRLRQELIARGELQPTEAQTAPTGVLPFGIGEIPGAIAKGFEKGVEEVAHTGADIREAIYNAAPVLKNNPVEALIPGTPEQLTAAMRNADLPSIGSESKTMVGKGAEVLTQLGVGAAASPVKGTTLLKYLIQGGIAGFMSLDPKENSTLSTTLNENPWLDQFIWDALVSDPDDTRWEGKLKLAAEDVLAGGVLHTLIGAIKAGKDTIKAHMVKAVPPEDAPLALPAPQKEFQVDSSGNATPSVAPNNVRAEGKAAQISARKDRAANARNESDAKNAAVDARMAENKAETERQAAFDAIQSQEAKAKQQQVETTYAQRDAARRAEVEADRLDDLANRAAINPQNKLKFGGKQSGQVNPEVFREGIKKIYDSTANFLNFVKEGKKKFGSAFEPIAESLYRSVRDEKGDIPKEASPRPRQGGYNPNKFNTTEEVKQYTDELVRKYGESREVKTWASVKAKANELGMSHYQILRLRNESKNWTARIKAAHDVSVDSWNATQQLAIKAVDGTTEDMMAAYQKMIEDAELLNAISGIRSEGGRLLNSLKMMADSRGEVTEAFRKHIEQGGGMESLRSIMHKVAEAGSMAEGRKIARKAMKEPTLVDAVLEYWINWGLLSGPQTHIVNFLSNGLMQGLHVTEMYGAAGIGKALGSADRISMAQANKFALGYKQAGLDAVKAAAKTFTSDDAIIVAGNREIRDELGKIELDQHKAWRASTFTRYLPSSVTSKLPESTRNRIAKWTDVTGEGVRLPGKGLYVGDAFWKTFAYRAKLNQLAQDEVERLLKAKAIKPEEAGASYQGIIDNPSKKIHDEALDKARELTFTKELGEAGKSIQGVARAIPLVKLGVPFIRTTLNIFKQGLHRTPVGLVMPEVVGALRAGGRARDEAMAKMLIGSSLGYTAWELAAAGLMTGNAPSDPQSRANFYESGRIPNAIKVGDTWVSIARLEPLATVMGAASVSQQVLEHMTKEEQDYAAIHVIAAMGKLAANKTFLESLGNMIKAITEPERYGNKWYQSTIASFAVPNLAAQIARDIDPHIKEIETVTDAVWQRIPFKRDEVTNKLNRWGEEIEYGGSMLNPFWDSDATDSKFLKSMYKNDIQVGMPSNVIDGVELSPKLYNQFVKFGRIPARRQLEEMYNTSNISLASPELQAKQITHIVEIWDNFARMRMIPIIKEERTSYMVQKARALATPEKERIKVRAE